MDDQGSAASLKAYMREMLRNYQLIRSRTSIAEDGGDATRSPPEERDFWDVVVLSACDESQASAFRRQLNDKKKRNELPSADYLVVQDVPPRPGCKIGAGGSTLLVIEELRMSVSFDKKKVLLIHAGGWSQRLPFASVLGKLFMPFPSDGFDFDMLDIKLAIYLPFLPYIRDGIFLTASDDIELFHIDPSALLEGHPEGFVALGHPSNLYIGSTHGVYVCDLKGTSSPTFLTCSRVLQKPSIEEMKKVSAVREDSDGKEFVISDSAYWFDLGSVDKLHHFHEMHGLPAVEVDAYGDFLQPLGTAATESYIDRTKDSELKRTRKLLFDQLHGSPLQVLYLPESVFIHLGTMPEYLENFIDNQLFRSCFGIGQTIVKSRIHPRCSISPRSVLEYCDFSGSVTVEGNCIISSCSTGGQETDEDLLVPENTFLHTVVVSVDGEQCYTTIFCGVSDDIKAETEVKDLRIFGKPLPESLLLILDKKDCKVSLWTLRIFPVCQTPRKSFAESLERIHEIRHGKSISRSFSRKYISMADISLYKDVDGMLEYRRKLRDTLTHKSAAKAIFLSGVDAVKPRKLVENTVRVCGDRLKIMDFNGVEKFDGSVDGDFWMIGVGKAAAGLFDAVHGVLGERVKGGVVMMPSEFRETAMNDHRYKFFDDKNVLALFGGTNNLPDQFSIDSTQRLILFLQSIPPPATLICVISGGASAILVAPSYPLTLQEKLTVIHSLVKSGAPIGDLNTVRGCLSDVKNGGLLKHISPGVQTVSILLSDIIGDRLELIGGGPTISKITLNSDAVTILRKYGAWEDVSSTVRQVLSQPNSSAFHWDSTNVLIGNNTVALRACLRKASDLGYQSFVLDDSVCGEASEVGTWFSGIFREVSEFRNKHGATPKMDAKFVPELVVDWTKPLCFLTGGETTVLLRGNGKGGRNQEMVLAFLQQLAMLSLSGCPVNIDGAFLSGGTDGQDGPTDVAGAVVGFPFTASKELFDNISLALKNNDSYNFFARNPVVGSLLKTGLTGTNVMDLQVLLSG